jgi:hypothetical protein
LLPRLRRSHAALGDGALRLPCHLAGQLGGLGLCPALDVRLGGELLYRLAETLPGLLDFLAELLGAP